MGLSNTPVGNLSDGAIKRRIKNKIRTEGRERSKSQSGS